MKKELIFFLIDDDKDDIEIFDLALKQTDQPVKMFSAKNGNDAIKMFSDPNHFTPDFIFLDLDMPVMNGRECLEAIKKIEHLQNVPVYIYTTSPHPRDEAELILSGATLFIFKPSYIQDLILFLKTILNTKTNKDLN
jgi:response regulator RpfG family c-di-GMP phosphodiesterase